jgi:hypothetical protein
MAVNNPQDYALVIGINHYPNYRSLSGAVADAREVAGWLTDRRVGGGLPKTNCKTYLSRSKPLKPLFDDVDQALDEIRQQAAQTGARRLYFYFSGHGQTGEIEDVNLCLGRWAPAGASRMALSASGYYRFFAECVGFKEIVVLLDCCRLRVVGASGLPPGQTCVRPVDTAGQARFFKAFATEFLAPSFEAAVAAAEAAAAPPGTVESAEADAESAPEVRGHFTRALLAALRGGAAGPGPGVRPSALQAYLEREVPRIADGSNHRQNARVPQNELPDAPGSLFGSAPPAAAGNLVIRFTSARTGDVVLIGPEGDECSRGPASSGPWQFSLPKGLYLLEDLVTGQTLDIRHRPAEGISDVEF